MYIIYIFIYKWYIYTIYIYMYIYIICNVCGKILMELDQEVFSNDVP